MPHSLASSPARREGRGIGGENGGRCGRFCAGRFFKRGLWGNVVGRRAEIFGGEARHLLEKCGVLALRTPLSLMAAGRFGHVLMSGGQVFVANLAVWVAAVQDISCCHTCKMCIYRSL